MTSHDLLTSVGGHRLRPMRGRDPRESHRAATPLELLFDLVFVASFAVAGTEASHLIAEGHVGAAVAGFLFAMFAVCWAWIQFAWFASAFDTDDWFYRITTMVQMIGVIILALGLPPMFESIDHGEVLDNGVMVAGYIVMRIAMVVQWLRAARQDPTHRATAIGYAVSGVVAQIGWTAAILLPIRSLLLYVVVILVLAAVEMLGPVLSERRAVPLPWHPHHIAERYGLFVIIALGEGIIGTIAAVSAVVGRIDWSLEAALVMLAGTAMTFGLWWVHFIPPYGRILERHPQRAWVWGYGHIVLLASIAAVGVGLHVGAYVVEGEAHIGTIGALLAVAIPLLVYIAGDFLVYSIVMRTVDPFHMLLFAGSVVVLAAAVALAGLGFSLGWCLIVAALSPWVTVVGFEAVGHRHMAVALRSALGE